MKEYGGGYNTIYSLNIDESGSKYDLLIKSIDNAKTTIEYKTIKKVSPVKSTMIKFPKEKQLVSVKTEIIGDKKVYGGVYKAEQKLFQIYESGISHGIAIGMSGQSGPLFNVLLPYHKFKSIQHEPNIQNQLKKNDKNDAAVSMSVLFHDILIKDNEVVFIGEIYYRHTHNEMGTAYTSAGGVQAVMPTFDGFKRKGILLFALDFKGNLLWDNGIQIKDGTNSVDLKHKVKFKVEEDGSIGACYGDGESVQFVTFKKGDKPVIVKETRFESKKGKNTYNKKNTSFKDAVTSPGMKEDVFFESTLEYWYDGHFIEYGEAFIDSKTKDKKGKNKVLYLSKIVVD